MPLPLTKALGLMVVTSDNIRILFLLLVVLVIGCKERPPLTLTAEQQVYESLFLATVNDFTTPIHIAGHTDSRWFQENPTESVLARVQTEIESPDDRRGFISLLPELYRINATSESIGWRPTLVNGIILPGTLAANPIGNDVDAHCLVAEGEGNIGVSIAEGSREFRSYYTVSRVAVAEDGAFALLKYGYHCAPLSGAGESLLLFRFQNNSWQLAAGLRFWIS